MFSLAKLAALDLVLWLGTCERAAQLAGTNQSTISRRSRAVLEHFDLQLKRHWAGWCLDGDSHLLGLERRVHQRARFLGHDRLRLQVPYWTQRSRLLELPEGWSENPLSTAAVCEQPVELLRQRTIDACLLPPTQIPDDTCDLVVLDLVRRPIELTLLNRDRHEDPRDAYRRQLETGSLRLRLMSFLPRSCRLRSSEWFSDLIGAGARPSAPTAGPMNPAEAHDFGVAFLTPEMRTAQEEAWVVDDSVAPYPYVERLAVLAENAEEPAVLRLQEQLLQSVAIR